MTKQSDVLILGSDIAGMTAAQHATNVGLRTMLLEIYSLGRRNGDIPGGPGMPSRQALCDIAVMQLIRAQKEACGVRTEEACEVQGLNLSEPMKTITTELGDYQARVVIINTGLKPQPLEAENAEGCRQVHHCAACNGAPYIGKRVLVVGGCNSGFEEGLYLAALGAKEVLLVEAMPQFLAAPAIQNAFLACPGTTARHSTKVKSLDTVEGKLAGVTVEPTKGGAPETIPMDGVFVCMGAGHAPNSDLFLHTLQLDQRGFIITNEGMETGIPGVYAVGDVRAKAFRRVATSMSDGAIAALNAEQYLRG